MKAKFNLIDVNRTLTLLDQRTTKPLSIWYCIHFMSTLPFPQCTKQILKWYVIDTFTKFVNVKIVQCSVLASEGHTLRKPPTLRVRNTNSA